MRIVPKIFIPILLVTLFVFLPFLANPNLLLARNNDLTEFFWPILYYIKQSIFTYHQIPLWNNMFFMGTPLISDPQNLFWYLPNAIFLILPIDAGIIITFILHSLFGGIGTYQISKEFKLSNNASIFAACLFIVSPKLAGYIEAGHFGLVLSFAWLPWIIYLIKKLTSEPKLKWSILLTIGLSSIYFNHILTALITVFALAIFGLILFLGRPGKKTFFYTILSAVLFILIISPALYAQTSWFPQTTRDLLLKYPDVYPKWDTEIEFIKNFFWPIKTETEKIISLGIVTTILSLIGLLRLKTKLKIIFVSSFLAIALISTNNLSPIYDLLISQNWFIMLRVATRVWFIVALIAVFLAAIGFEQLVKRHSKLALVIAFTSIIELVFLGYKIILKPISTPLFTPPEVYEYISSDKDNFKVFCTTRCLSQKQSAIYDIKLAEGYGTLQQKNYYEAAKQIGQYYSDRYSLSIPPFDIYLYQKLQPHAPTLGTYGIKYVISPHPLKDKNLIEINKINEYRVYQNNLYQKQNYLIYTPNYIKVQNLKRKEYITISEIYNSNWHAYDEFGNSLDVFETANHIIEVKTNNSKSVSLKFIPYPNLFK